MKELQQYPVPQKTPEQKLHDMRQRMQGLEDRIRALEAQAKTRTHLVVHPDDEGRN